ncbi:MAG: hypothetical protein ABSG01_13090 [Anaerolineales bacterium]
MHAKTGTTLLAGPPGCFLFNKAPHPVSSDALQICNDTYSVSCPVARVKTEQFSARVLGTGIAELMIASGELCTILDGTIEACVRLVGFAATASGARSAISHVCAA